MQRGIPYCSTLNTDTRPDIPNIRTFTGVCDPYTWRARACTRPGYEPLRCTGRVQARKRPRAYPDTAGHACPRHPRDTLLFYTEHRCWHIRLCPVRAKLPAPANDSGFRTVETISVHREGFTLHDDKHNSYSRIQSKSGTKYQADFGMSTLRCRLQQEFTG
ncbi:hypothetical protein Bbelb_320220 [Branchiostoma belcheri]|nr:hypothetical protein Bbelb_320220 [Branchiostoma belcheri]